METDFKAFKRELEAIPQRVKDELQARKKNNDVGQWYAMWDELADNPGGKPDLQVGKGFILSPSAEASKVLFNS